MDTKAIRRKNLRDLVAQTGGQSVLAQKIGTSSAYISQLLSEKIKADVGTPLARKIEEIFQLEKYFMDTDHSDKRAVMVPIYDDFDILEMTAGRDLPTRERELVPTFRRLTDTAYAYQLEAEDMSPTILPGSILFVEPNLDFKSGNVVLVAGAESVYARTLMREIDGQMTLVPADRRLTAVAVSDAVKNAGVVVEAIKRTIFIKSEQIEILRRS